MNAAHAHLLVNHLPVVGVLFAFLALVLSSIKKRDEMEWGALVLFVVVGIAVLPAYFSGEGAEKVVEHLPGVAEKLIENHEETAEAAAILTVITGLTALVGIFFRQHRTKVFLGLYLLSLITGGTLAYTAKLGGEIRHQEIRKDFVPVQKGQGVMMGKEDESAGEEEGEKGEEAR
ncbi:MAG: hypothetical protein HZA01_03980 [Nitrospinae bacterium]|nr:hypothetical protein [Nitrospinota bacterium]